ncbi:MAG: hypothetical protein KGK07_01360 [Chloroflexota bacterium]|nr:hypothetical protein [Chloroflexota bacterium]
MLVGATVVVRPASAQTQPPPDVLCTPPDPARALHLALGDPKLIIAVAQATGPRDLVNGTPVRVVRVVEGEVPAGVTLADRPPAVACLSDGVWDPARAVVGVFMVQPGQLVTLAAWPLTGGLAQIGGQSLSIDELLALGHAYVEPTPTPLPSGVAPPPAIIPVDTGGPAGLPATGEPPGGGSWPRGWLVAAVVTALMGAGVLAAARRR